MLHVRFRPRRARKLMRHLILCAVLALQGSVAASPIFESRETGTPAAHMERKGERHLNVHNESICMLCAVRAMHAAPALPSEPVLLEAEHSRYPAAVPHAVPAREEYGSHPSRAPPRLS
jgi:hypothetical protein